MTVLLPSGINTTLRATVITDASYCPLTGAGGWAGWIKIDNLATIKESGVLLQSANSTAAEVMAAANGVWCAARAGARQLLLQSDCMAVIHIVGGRSRAPHLIEIWQTLMAMPVMAGVQITARHVKGHGVVKDARTWVNDWCDKTARVHMERKRAALRPKSGKGNRQGSSGARGSQKGSHPLGGFCPRP